MKKIMLSFIFVLIAIAASAESIRITGRVCDTSGEPITGAQITVMGTSIGTETDTEGKYILIAPSDAWIVASSVGYSSLAKKAASKLNFILSDELNDIATNSLSTRLITDYSKSLFS